MLLEAGILDISFRIVQRKRDRDFAKDAARSQEMRISCERAAPFPASREHPRNSSRDNFALRAILDNFYVSHHFRQNTYCHPFLFFLSPFCPRSLLPALLSYLIFIM